MEAVSGQRNDIQGLRALAVLAIIVFHVNQHWLPGGFVGVDIFFVISGFLITGILARQKVRGSVNVLSFYTSRLRRIVPAYVFLLAIVTVVMAILLIPRDFDSFFDSLKSALYFNSNNYFNSQNDYFAAASYERPLLHTWSLAIEMQFYLVLPVLVVLMPVRFVKPALVILAAIFVLHAEYQLVNDEKQSVYFSLLARVPEFLIGSLLAVSASGTLGGHNNLKAWAGTALLIFSVVCISEASRFPGFLALAPCIGTALLLSAPDSLVNRWLAGRVMVFIGGLSYSLYLWHWPVLAGLRYFLEVYELSLSALVLFAVLTLALSMFSYYFIEHPFRRPSVPNVQYKLAAFSALAAALILAAKVTNPLLVPPMAVELTRYALPETICHGQIVGECLRGDPQGSREILLLGDSHAAQLNYFADVVGRAINARIRVITASSCIPIAGFDKERITERARRPCEEQTLALQRYRDSADAVWLAGMWQYHVPSEKFLRSFERFLSETEARRQPLIVLAQVPMLTSNVQRMHRFNELGSARTAHLENTWASANQQIANRVAQHPNAAFFDPAVLALFSTPPIADGRLIYRDNHHLNEVGSNAYGRVAADLLASELSRLQQVTSELKIAAP
ncbi:putative peptidoglycan O-acetyltransferase YrhL [Pseudomonas reidholzensis]|uniref:Putative peptidoglycan O-acetyltransferase YrhL n=1 Tax=Pseudomonas reidholzensis TaxID=1785162 RepID=A0A383RQV2_9PSED|nr:acyltransferase family protein [Pseudomonas reidholzensis]SYX89449.1 putative peptidoglycan O-acetyltransferase YrhL [Pseudomonas reidholzensis]